MSTPKYFQYFPNIQYATSINKAGVPSFVSIKDYFHLLTVRDDIYREETLYTKYNIQDGERPDEISYKVYGESSKLKENQRNLHQHMLEKQNRLIYKSQFLRNSDRYP